MLSRNIGENGYQFGSLEEVRAATGLPADFSLKDVLDYSPPTRPLWETAELVKGILDKLLTTVPETVTPANLPTTADRLAAVLRSELIGQATAMGTSIEEIDTIVLDFQDLIMPGIYALIAHKLHPSAAPLAEPDHFIASFLDNTSYWGGEQIEITLEDEKRAMLAVAYDHFGPFGLALTADSANEPLYAIDDSLADPAGKPLQMVATAVLRSLFSKI